jgi:enoyl-[acyl-carrier protein] reductase III
MYPELAGKHALVTGATRGFGRAIAVRLAREGVRVVVNFRRSKTEALGVVEEIEQAGGWAVAMRGDVGREESLDKLFDEVTGELGQLDILVANAAFGVPGVLTEATAHHWEVTMHASAYSLLAMTQRALPLMTSGWGRIVSITSEGGQRVLPGYGVVGIAKSALESLTRSLSVELAERGILVNGVLAGVADTRSMRSIPGSDVMLETALRSTPAGRVIVPEDIANAVAFLVSNQSSMIIGQFLVVDGGFGVMR